jgi:hypothetical protein
VTNLEAQFMVAVNGSIHACKTDGWRRQLSPAVLAAALLLSIEPAYAQSACQTQLEAAVLKITSSGPVRIVVSQQLGTAGESIETVEFVPPHSLRTTQSGRIWNGQTPPRVSTLIGGTLYSGHQKIVENAPFSNPVYEAGTLHVTADPRRFFAINCTGNKITLNYEVQGSLDNDFAKREASLKTLQAERATLPSGAMPPSLLEIDGQGRPIKLTVGEIRFPNMPPDNQTITYTYDLQIRIDPPK